MEDTEQKATHELLEEYASQAEALDKMYLMKATTGSEIGERLGDGKFIIGNKYVHIRNKRIESIEVCSVKQ